jgi:hypothetical protein
MYREQHKENAAVISAVGSVASRKRSWRHFEWVSQSLALSSEDSGMDHGND